MLTILDILSLILLAEKPWQISFTPIQSVTMSSDFALFSHIPSVAISSALPKPIPRFHYEFLGFDFSAICWHQPLYELFGVPIPSVIESPKKPIFFSIGRFIPTIFASGDLLF